MIQSCCSSKKRNIVSSRSSTSSLEGRLNATCAHMSTRSSQKSCSISKGRKFRSNSAGGSICSHSGDRSIRCDFGDSSDSGGRLISSDSGDRWNCSDSGDKSICSTCVVAVVAVMVVATVVGLFGRFPFRIAAPAPSSLVISEKGSLRVHAFQKIIEREKTSLVGLVRNFSGPSSNSGAINRVRPPSRMVVKVRVTS